MAPLRPNPADVIAAFVALALALAPALAMFAPTSQAWSSFHGSPVSRAIPVTGGGGSVRRRTSYRGQGMSMRKQKASDRRARRMQQGGLYEDTDLAPSPIPIPGLTASPMESAAWKHRRVGDSGKKRNAFPAPSAAASTASGGRGRSRKKAAMYSALSRYHNNFVGMLTTEYRAEVSNRPSFVVGYLTNDARTAAALPTPIFLMSFLDKINFFLLIAVRELDPKTMCTRRKRRCLVGSKLRSRILSVWRLPGMPCWTCTLSVGEIFSATRYTA